MLTTVAVVANHPTRRKQLLVLIMAADPTLAAGLAEFWHGRGAVVLQARDEGGCLRVATAVGPDVIALDRYAPRRLLRLIRAHPVSGRAEIEWVQDASRPAILAA
jgi:hypothetical protein